MENEEEEEDDEDEDEDEDEEEENDEEEEEEEPDLSSIELDDTTSVPNDIIPPLKVEDRFFMHNEQLRKKYNEVELDSFMKLLNVKPTVQWEDDTLYHYKVGTHTYEDDN